jgi:hypothetical protein
MSKAIRIDDIGASTKKYEVYSKVLHPFGNYLFLKYLPPFKAWAPYREMTINDWQGLFSIIEQYNAVLTVSITATWVEKDGSKTPYFKKYPAQAEFLKKKAHQGKIEIANHGLTHCVVGRHLPRAFGSNRSFHREFWDWLPADLHFEHIKESQHLLQSWLELPITTLVPPGNVFSLKTLDAAIENGIQTVNCYTKDDTYKNLTILSNADIIDFHDHEIVKHSPAYLKNRISREKSTESFLTVSQLAKTHKNTANE